MARAIMFLGTGSNVGKSISATAFCRILKRKGYHVAPFKAQNMSNNSYVTPDGGEIGRSQVVQAEAAGILPSIHMNPLLLKPSTGQGSQIVLHGRVAGQMTDDAHPELRQRLKRAVLDSYKRLSSQYELIVLEGAGSCCEMNLKAHDIVNFAMARAVGAACVLVADIDCGGVFAQIIGSYHLMTRIEKALTVGFLINKFRGDPSRFASGIRYIEKKTGKPVLGLVPFFHDIQIDPEDSVAIQEGKRRPRPIGPATINIAVIKFPAISNFTDLERLASEPDVVLNYLFHPREFSEEYDALILPGTKNVMEDALWISRTGWKKAVGGFVKNGGRIFGICGGYQLLGERIMDPWGVESDRQEVRGLNLLPIESVLEKEKVVRKVNGIALVNGKRIRGYEIHMGASNILRKEGEPLLRIRRPGTKKSWTDGWRLDEGRICGTYVHGILDSPGFRTDFLNGIRREKGLRERRSGPGRLARFHQYDRLADHFEAHCDVERLISAITPEPALRG
ncbi:MAG: cobyric acid synthase [Deltaproteobacteria bacterium]|nr:cobyric acid synthase [Deltaproteobacteria bacterium]